MNKYFFTAFYGLLTIVISLNTNAQNAYYDALKLKVYVNEDGDLDAGQDSVYFILDSYFQPKKKNTIHELDSIIRLKQNIFLTLSGTARSDVNINKTGNITSILSSFGSLNVTNIADGIAQFLIKRGKEELNVAFFNRLKKFIDSTEECKVLFPQSLAVFKNVEPYQYAEFIQSLREGFKKDLDNLIVGVNELIELQKYQELLKKLPEIRLAIRCSKIVQELSQSDGGILPDSIITQLATLKEFSEIDLNLGSAWKLLNVISQSVRYVPNNKNTEDTINNDKVIKDTVIKVNGNGIPDTVINDRIIKNRITQNATIKDSFERRWITLSDMNELVKDPITLKIFLGLIYQKADSINFEFKKVNVSVQEFMKTNVDNIFKVSSLIENFVTLANDVDKSIKDIKDKQKNHTLTNDDYYTYISKAINITEYGFKAANTVFRLKAINKKDNDLSDNRYIIIAKNGNELYKNIYTKNYNNAVMNVYNILDQGFFNKDNLAKEKTEAPNFDSARKEFVDSVKKIEVLNPKILAAVLEYGNFMASVVKAESGEEVEQALESVVLPAGSYSIKQKASFNVSVNGYIGYAWDFDHGSLFAQGVYAPVGINLNWGTKKGFPTFSLFCALIDVGSIATYRLQDDTTKKLKQEIRLESIFSPSVQLFIEPIKNFPLAIGGGWRRTPKLFYSGNTSFETVLPRNVFNLSAVIDIPFFTIVNKSFKRE